MRSVGPDETAIASGISTPSARSAPCSASRLPRRSSPPKAATAQPANSSTDWPRLHHPRPLCAIGVLAGVLLQQAPSVGRPRTALAATSSSDTFGDQAGATRARSAVRAAIDLGRYWRTPLLAKGCDSVKLDAGCSLPLRLGITAAPAASGRSTVLNRRDPAQPVRVTTAEGVSLAPSRAAAGGADPAGCACRRSSPARSGARRRRWWLAGSDRDAAQPEQHDHDDPWSGHAAVAASTAHKSS